MVLFSKPMYPEQQCQYVKMAATNMKKSAKVLTKDQPPKMTTKFKIVVNLLNFC